MYSLIVTYEEDAWVGREYELPSSRLGEHTDSSLKFAHLDLSSRDYEGLLAYPALLAYESVRNAPAQVVRLTKIRERQNLVRFSWERVIGIPSISASRLVELVWELDIDKWELNRTHWALKDVDLFEVLVEIGLATADELPTLPPPPSARRSRDSLHVTPRVFDVPEGGQETDLVSVMMPFRAEFRPTYDTIHAVCDSVGLRCQRADNIWEDSTVIQDVFTLIHRSSVVVADFSGRNANVLYEAGIAHTLGRHVLPLAQDERDIPFDLRHHRFLKYLPNEQGLREMVPDLERRLKRLTS